MDKPKMTKEAFFAGLDAAYEDFRRYGVEKILLSKLMDWDYEDCPFAAASVAASYHLESILPENEFSMLFRSTNGFRSVNYNRGIIGKYNSWSYLECSSSYRNASKYYYGILMVDRVKLVDTWVTEWLQQKMPINP